MAMNRKILFIISKVALLIVGAIIFLNAVAVSMASNFNLGIVLTFLLGGALIVCGVFLGFIVRRLPKWLWITGLCCMALVLVCASTLLIYGRSDNVTHDEDAIIVLGAGIHGERVSLTLRDRLNAAIACYEQNPDAVIVVSGGQGPQEEISEALAMERYLIEHGIPQGSIIKEDKSTSTAENFAFSKALLNERFGESYSAVYVTNDFHIFRAGQIARDAGLSNMNHAHSDTVWYLVVPSCLRECVAVLYYWLFGA
ncbi:MAG: YdcF family protein [Ruminococcaceae bacterium]|nr:YdcF family protein [Oscillospiraceae bacterium]